MTVREYVEKHYEEMYEIFESHAIPITKVSAETVIQEKFPKYSITAIRNHFTEVRIDRGDERPKRLTLPSILKKHTDEIIELWDNVRTQEKREVARKFIDDLQERYPEYNLVRKSVKNYVEIMNRIYKEYYTEKMANLSKGDVIRYEEFYDSEATDNSDIQVMEGRVIKEYPTFYLVNNGNYNTTIFKY